MCSHGCCYSQDCCVLAQIRLSLTASVPAPPVYLTGWTQDADTEVVSHGPSTCNASPGKSQEINDRQDCLDCAVPMGMQRAQVCNWPCSSGADQDFHIVINTWLQVSSKQKLAWGNDMKQLFCSRSQIVVGPNQHWAHQCWALDLIRMIWAPYIATVLPSASVTHSPGQRAVANCPGPVKMCQAPVAALPTAHEQTANSFVCYFLVVWAVVDWC